MPETVTESVFHYENGSFWVAPETREIPTYDEEVAARVEELRREHHPAADYPSAYFEHEPGECVECDALRLLDGEDDD